MVYVVCEANCRADRAEGFVVHGRAYIPCTDMPRCVFHIIDLAVREVAWAHVACCLDISRFHKMFY